MGSLASRRPPRLVRGSLITLRRRCGEPLSALKSFFTGGGSLSANWQTSDASNLSQLGGVFHETSGSLFLGLGGSYENFSGGGVSGQQWGIGVGRGGSIGKGVTCTDVQLYDPGSQAADWGSSEIDFLNHFNPLSWGYGI
jgi:hypothetical protein